MLTKEKVSLLTTRIVQLLKSEPNGLRKNIIYSRFRPNAKQAKSKAPLHPMAPSYNYETATKPTIDKAMKEGIIRGLIQFNPLTRHYSATTKGKEYLEQLNIADWVLKSNYWFSDFSWDSTSRAPAAAIYNMIRIQGEESGHSAGLLKNRMSRTKPLEWFDDFLDYVIKIGLLDAGSYQIWRKLQEGKATENEVDLFQEKIRNLWQTVFQGVKRMTVVETVNPSLMFERIDKSLTALGKDVKNQRR
jgi:DNA-binding PadR family transcriptional regulator